MFTFRFAIESNRKEEKLDEKEIGFKTIDQTIAGLLNHSDRTKNYSITCGIIESKQMIQYSEDMNEILQSICRFLL